MESADRLEPKNDLSIDVDVAVIGGGVAGLATCRMLHAAGHDVVLLEARNAIGGRVRSARSVSTGAHIGDLGPTWVWAGLSARSGALA